MKLLMFRVLEFSYRTHVRNLDTEPEREESGGMPDGGLLVWVQVEPADLGRRVEVVRKAIKNIKWLARRHEVERITIHSFAHLATERAEPEEARPILAEIEARLASVGFEVDTTPWGYFNAFTMHVDGPGLAKVFADI
ncbi:MAG: hypothetical protein KDC38_13690 [Planctomycetes bacterium]|nr:hypothetical protein [Planctomycetota bacterium]